MTLVPVTYIKAGEVPANWFDLSVIDADTGKDVRFVVEADTKAGWAKCRKIGRDGQFVRFAGQDVTDVLHGNFTIINPAVPGVPVMVAKPEPVKPVKPLPAPKKARPKTFPTTRIFFDRPCSASLVGPSGSVAIAGQVATLLMVLCGKPERHISAWMDIAECLWPDPDAMPDAWSDQIGIQMCRLRKALKSINSEIRIVTHWGRGFSTARGPYPQNDNAQPDIAQSA
ncbi:helix-turn-helix domain-containing protein [Paremcibacter congregatus]|uniref:helix-turn-helix domain-containing protein n=1 Tax=Paremcibacter congregatus TaxID=2043170 RepID=UPI003A93D363